MVPLRPPFAATTLLLLGLALGGCATHSHIVAAAASSDAPSSTTPGFDIPTTPPVAIPMAFDLLPEDTKGVSRKLSNWLSDWMSGRYLEPYELATLGFDALADNGQPDNLNRLRYYRGSGEGRLPLVLVLPVDLADEPKRVPPEEGQKPTPELVDRALHCVCVCAQLHQRRGQPRIRQAGAQVCGKQHQRGGQAP